MPTDAYEFGDTTVLPSHASGPPVIITGSLSWCVAAGVHVFQQVQASADLIPVHGADALTEQLHATPAATVVYVCIAASPRHFDGLERLRGEHPHAKVIAASFEPNVAIVQHARALGLMGYVHFDAAPLDLAAAIHRVDAGERSFLRVEPAPSGAPEQLEDPDLERRVQRLTRRERQVMDLLGQGFANREIAETLGLREGTIRIYVHRVIRQLGMRNRVDVALCASRMRKPA